MNIMEKDNTRKAIFLQSLNDFNGVKIKLGVGALIVNNENKLLLDYRADCNLWGTIGGAVDVGESVSAALHREVREETGLTVNIDYLQGIYSGPNNRFVHYLSNDNLVQLVDLVFHCTVKEGTLTPSSETGQLRFFKLENLPKKSKIIPPAWAILDDFFKGKKNQIL